MYIMMYMLKKMLYTEALSPGKDISKIGQPGTYIWHFSIRIEKYLHLKSLVIDKKRVPVGSDIIGYVYNIGAQHPYLLPKQISSTK